MLSRASAQFKPMETAGTHHLVDRTYREGGQFQWVRETLINAMEAGATRVEFGIEWQAAENRGVYRRMIADNGCGMTPGQLVQFFNTYGGGGKPIGGIHENFGVGSKTSLLPWNEYGMVVISWVNGEASMIWVYRNKETNEYGLKIEGVADGPHGAVSLEPVYGPYPDEAHGCDWTTVKPDWIQEHGTVIILMGNRPDEDTVLGDPDPDRNEGAIKGLSSYLNRRIWELENVDVYVEELKTSDKAEWPRSEEEAHSTKAGADRRTNMRRIEGARYYIEYPNERFAPKGRIAASGTVPLTDGTCIDWFLWDGERPKLSAYAAETGFIAALYKNELYDITSHHSTYRSFGVSEQSVRSRLWLILRPLVDEAGKLGVYPKSDRNSLLMKGGALAGKPLPLNDWAGEFADNMPTELIEAIKSARHGQAGTITNEEWRERLAERFGSRWRIAGLRVIRNGTMLATANGLRPIRQKKTPAISDHASPSPGPSPGRPSSPRPAPQSRLGFPGGTSRAERIVSDGGIPRFRTVGQDEVGEGMMAAWQPNDPEYPEGVVLINVDHPVLKSVIEHWQSQYADHHHEAIAHDVIEIYGQVAVSKIAHSEHLKGVIPSEMIERNLRSESSLTFALLGLMAEDHLISTRIGGKYKRNRRISEDEPRAKPALPR